MLRPLKVVASGLLLSVGGGVYLSDNKRFTKYSQAMGGHAGYSVLPVAFFCARNARAFLHARAGAIPISPKDMTDMKKNSKLRNRLFDEAVRLYFVEGATEDAVARKLNVGHTTVNRWVNDYAAQHGTDKRTLRAEMGGAKSDKAVAQDVEKEKLLRQLTRKLHRARQQVIMLENLIRTLTTDLEPLNLEL